MSHVLFPSLEVLLLPNPSKNYSSYWTFHKVKKGSQCNLSTNTLKDLPLGIFLLLCSGASKGVFDSLRQGNPFSPLPGPSQFFLHGSKRKTLQVTRPILLQSSQSSIISSKHLILSPKGSLLLAANWLTIFLYCYKSHLQVVAVWQSVQFFLKLGIFAVGPISLEVNSLRTQTWNFFSPQYHPSL